MADLLTPLLLDLLGQADEALKAPDHPSEPPARVLLMPGADVVHDDCCDGQLWARVIEVLPHYSTPGRGKNCGVDYWTATIGLGIVRCAATLDSRGNPPSAENMSADTVLQNLDAHLLSGVFACFSHVTRVTRWRPVGPRGGCVGGEWTGQVRYGI